MKGRIWIRYTGFEDISFEYIGYEDISFKYLEFEGIDFGNGRIAQNWKAEL